MNKPNLYVIVGPTATGKSDYAVQLAKKVNGEIISADSRQVYKGLNIGTGKISKKEMKGVKHYMLDVISPKKIYNASNFKTDALKCIETIISRKKTPIICGGTGFYIDTLLGEIILDPSEPNEELRNELSKLSKEQLQEKLEKLDPAKYELVDINNPVRLIRAIEIAISKKSGIKKEVSNALESKDTYNVIKIGLDFPDEILKHRIHERLLKRLKQGMVNEAKSLHENGLTYKRMNQLGLEYRYLADLLQKKINKDEFLEQLEKEIWHYAKRQRTWFKRDKEISWIKH